MANQAPTFAVNTGVFLGYNTASTRALAITTQTDGKILVAGSKYDGIQYDFYALRLNINSSIDTTFNSSGSIYFPITPLAIDNDTAYSITTQSDGKILLSGISHVNGQDIYSVARLNTDGSLDTSFHTTGTLQIHVTPYLNGGGSIALQQDGKILIGGFDWTISNNPPGDFNLIRLNSDGSLDTSFNSTGILAQPVGTNWDHGQSLALQSDGKIVMAGTSWNGSNHLEDFSVIRLNSDGSLDTTFNGSGKVITGGTNTDTASDMALQSDGKIVVVGTTYSSLLSSNVFSIIRLNPDGSLDTGFNGSGQILVDIAAGSDHASAVQIQSDGKIVVAGYSQGDGLDFSIIRLNSDGSLDNTFNSSGKLVLPIYPLLKNGSSLQLVDEVLFDLTIQSDGKIILTGSTQTGFGGLTDTLLIRLNPDGTPDTSFGNSSMNTLGGSTSYIFGSTPIILDSAVVIHDAEMAALNNFMGDYSGSSMTLSRQGTPNIHDIFGASKNLTLSSGSVSLSGVSIGTYVQGSGTLTIIFNSNATQARVNEALSSLTYANDDVTSMSGTISIQWLFNTNDGSPDTTATGYTYLTAGSTDLSLSGTSGADTIVGAAGNDILSGFDGNDLLLGNAGADSLASGLGDDTMVGGLGDDVYQVDSSGDIVIESFDEGNDTVVSRIDYTLPDNIEMLNLWGTAVSGSGNNLDNIIITFGISGLLADNKLYGLAGNDYIEGLGSNNTIDGGTGNDTMSGGSGNDAYYRDSVQDVIIENAGEGTDSVFSSLNYTLGVNLENLTLTGTALNAAGNALDNVMTGTAGNNLLWGLSGNDTLNGGAGNDTLDGGLGTDVMAGGTGNDLYYRDSTTDVITELLGEGTDTVISSLNYTLGANLENLTLTGTALNAAGNALDNVMTGIAGNNLLWGLAGNDSVSGGAGNDTLDGGQGTDTLDGGLGTDAMTGGTGNDLYYRDSTTDVITELLGEGTDTVISSLNYSLGANLENLTLTGAALNAAGNALDNVMTGTAGNNLLWGLAGNDALIGGAGNDTLDGGLGNDTMTGGAGNDLYYRDSASDVLTELVGEGTDTVISSLNYTLGANLENLTLTGTALNAAGNALDNVMTGTAGNNLLWGLAGNDALIGGTGNDTLDSGLGNDTLTGGAGTDLFVFSTALNPGTNTDTLTDFAAGDLIVLDNDIFTALGAAGNLGAAQFFSGAGMTGSASAAQGAGLYFDTTAGILYYDSDGFGGLAATKFATLTGAVALSSLSFLIQE
jgi:uncharacterized delta-60 repeat protein